MLLDDRTGLEVLDRPECLRLLGTQFIGRIGLVVEGRALVMPVNYALDGEAVVFRTAPGSAFDRVLVGAEVAFEIDWADAAYHTSWSVLGRGVALEVHDPALLARCQTLHVRPWARVPSPRWVRIELTEVTGRRIVQVSA